MALNPNQARFVEEYLVDLNATQAAIRAGYSERSAHVTGTRLLANAKVREAVDEAKRARAERVEVKQDTVLRELLRIATVDIGQAYDEEGRLRPLKDIPEDVRRAIAGIEVDEIGGEEGGIGFTRKVKFWDKPKALELIGKHLKLFTDRFEVEGKLTLEQLVAASFTKPEDGE